MKFKYQLNGHPDLSCLLPLVPARPTDVPLGGSSALPPPVRRLRRSLTWSWQAEKSWISDASAEQVCPSWILLLASNAWHEPAEQFVRPVEDQSFRTPESEIFAMCWFAAQKPTVNRQRPRRPCKAYSVHVAAAANQDGRFGGLKIELAFPGGT